MVLPELAHVGGEDEELDLDRFVFRDELVAGGGPGNEVVGRFQDVFPAQQYALPASVFSLRNCPRANKGCSEGGPDSSTNGYRYGENASIPRQEQTGLRSPKTLSMRPTDGQNLYSRSQRAGKPACCRE